MHIFSGGHTPSLGEKHHFFEVLGQSGSEQDERSSLARGLLCSCTNVTVTEGCRLLVAEGHL